MSHLKRQKVPKNWPIARKGTKFVVRPSSNLRTGLPILIILRDLLKVAQNRKEVKRAIHEKNILLNKKVVREDKDSAILYDVVTIVPTKQNYVLGLKENGKFEMKEISEKEAGSKVAKVIGKKVLKNKKKRKIQTQGSPSAVASPKEKKVQLNLIDGRNFLTDLKCKTNDSVLINFEKKKIEKCLPLKENAKIIVFAGKHAGKEGVVEKLDLEKKMAVIKNAKHKVNVLIKQLMVVG